MKPINTKKESIKKSKHKPNPIDEIKKYAKR